MGGSVTQRAKVTAAFAIVLAQQTYEVEDFPEL